MLMCEELMQPFGCTLCYGGVTAIHHTGPDTTVQKQQPIQMYHNKMLYLWFVYMYKSAAQADWPPVRIHFYGLNQLLIIHSKTGSQQTGLGIQSLPTRNTETIQTCPQLTGCLHGQTKL